MAQEHNTSRWVDYYRSEIEGLSLATAFAEYVSRFEPFVDILRHHVPEGGKILDCRLGTGFIPIYL